VTIELDKLVAEIVGDEAAALSELVAWVTMVRAWNARMDMTAARDDRELVDLMVADASWLAKQLPTGCSVVDVGSGAGAPGLPLALLRPDLVVTLVEPMQKRAALLRMTAAKLRPRVTVEQCHGEDVVAAEPRFDHAISRATLPPASWLDLGMRLASEVWVLLARDEPPELESAHVTADDSYSWPLTGARRRVVRYRRGG